MTGKVVISVALDDPEDRDILRYLAKQKKGQRSAVIRKALRAQMGRGTVSLADVYQVVKGLERKLEAGAVVVASGSGGDDVPADVAAALDALGQV